MDIPSDLPTTTNPNDHSQDIGEEAGYVETNEEPHKHLNIRATASESVKIRSEPPVNFNQGGANKCNSKRPLDKTNEGDTSKRTR